MVCPVCGYDNFIATTKGTMCKRCKSIVDSGLLNEGPKDGESNEQTQ